MKYKVGDKVLIRQWDDMAKEFWLDYCGDICTGDYDYTKEMYEFCGTVQEISNVKPMCYKLKNVDGYVFTDSMIERKVNEMTKADLKDGMVCKLRDGSVCVWFNGLLMGLNNYWSGTKNDLKNKSNKCCDVVEVYETDAYCIRKMFDLETHGNLIWKREEPKELTLAEIEKLLGYPVKIVEK